MEPKKVESLQTKIINSLRDHVTYNQDAQKKPQYFSRILDKLQVLRSLSQQALQRIFYLRLEGLVPEPPIIKKLFSSSIPFWTSDWTLTRSLSGEKLELETKFKITICPIFETLDFDFL